MLTYFLCFSLFFRCENDVVYLERGYWGYVDGKNKLRVLKCPQNFCQCNQTDTTKLGCAFNQTSQCKPGRTVPYVANVNRDLDLI